MYFISVCYIFLATFALSAHCISGSCIAFSLYALGALYYLSTAIMVVFLGGRITFLWMLSGVFVHVMLLAAGGIYCKNCTIFALSHIGFFAFYVILQKQAAKLKNPAVVYGTVFLMLLVIMAAVSLPGLMIGAEPKNEGRHLLNVITPNGREAVLDLKKNKALLFTSWCTHCDIVLREVARQGKRPYLVVVFPRHDEATKSMDKLKVNGLSEERFFLIEKPPTGIQGVPSLIWYDDELKHVEGKENMLRELAR